jgi:hypothetical protein
MLHEEGRQRYAIPLPMGLALLVMFIFPTIKLFNANNPFYRPIENI